MPLARLRWLLPLAFLLYLLVESLAFTSLADSIGFLPTFALAVLKPAAGAMVVLGRMRRTLAGLRSARAAVLFLSGARLSRGLAGAVLLVVPGFVSGALGLVLLWPAGRGVVRRAPADPRLVDLDVTQWREAPSGRAGGLDRSPERLAPKGDGAL